MITNTDRIIIKENENGFVVVTGGSEAKYEYVEGLGNIKIQFSVFEGNNLPSKWELSNENTLVYPLPQLPSDTDEDYHKKLHERACLIIDAVKDIIGFYIKCKKGEQE